MTSVKRIIVEFQSSCLRKWSHFNGNSYVALMGDAAYTAHFAIGADTKLAIDNAIELTRQCEIHGHDKSHIPAVLEDYEEIRRVDVARIQNAARNKMKWFEVVGILNILEKTCKQPACVNGFEQQKSADDCCGNTSILNA